MLKVYNKRTMISIDDEQWEQIGYTAKLMSENNPPEKIVFENKTFLECFEFLKEHFICGLCNEGSLVFRKPTIGISYTNHFSRISYKYFNKISCKYVYEENNYISLNEIMEDFPAERCIEYLKDHGIAACPILNK